MDEHARESLAGPHPVRRPRRFQRADDRRADRDDAMARLLRGVHQSRRLLRDLEGLRVDRLLFDGVRLNLEAADAGMEEDGREPNARSRKGLLHPWRDRPSRRWHLGAAGDAGEEASIRVERPGPGHVPVVDRLAFPLQDRLERPVRVDEPEPRDAGIRRDERHSRIAHGGVLARVDRHRSRMGRVPARLRQPDAFRVLRLSVYVPEAPRATRLAARVALSFATRRSPAERNRARSSNGAWTVPSGVVTRSRTWSRAPRSSSAGPAAKRSRGCSNTRSWRFTRAPPTPLPAPRTAGPRCGADPVLR